MDIVFWGLLVLISCYCVVILFIFGVIDGKIEMIFKEKFYGDERRV